MTAARLMVLGTSSHVGKSLLVAALGRIFTNEGLRVAPFKAQNMSLNSAATPDGLEIGRAQHLQAEACRVPPSVFMNPVLIKPSSDTGAQVIVMGKIWGQVTASDYHRRRVEELFPVVVDGYQKLAEDHDLVLLEGAGSPAEINLKARDIVNMRMAKAANAPCILVGDIDRGGVFAALLGTMELLDPDERRLVHGFIINKFRGDLELLREGIVAIEERVGIPCLGVIPYLHDLQLDEEDSVSLTGESSATKSWAAHVGRDSERPLRVGVIALPHMANFTDFDPIAAEPCAAIAFLQSPADIGEPPDVLILPGTKQTISDLEWLCGEGWDRYVSSFVKGGPDGRMLVGICGGMQMLGQSIWDEAGIENNGVPTRENGLALLPIDTTLGCAKLTQRAKGTVTADLFRSGKAELPVEGYEIHVGVTTYHPESRSFAKLQRTGGADLVLDGAVSESGRVWGTYLHGVFGNDQFRAAFLTEARQRAGLSEAIAFCSYSAERERRMNRWANHVRKSLHMEKLRRIIHSEDSPDGEVSH